MEEDKKRGKIVVCAVFMSPFCPITQHTHILIIYEV